MAKNEKAGEQLDLIEVAPENAKQIIDAARLYKKARNARLTALKKEIDLKEKVLRLVKSANLQTLEGGKIKFKYGGFIFSVTPRDDLINIIEEKKKKNKSKYMKKTVKTEELEFEKNKKTKEDK